MAIDIVAELKKNPFVLAPMAAITDCAFRSFMREMGAGIVVTELVSSYGILYASGRTFEIMRFTESQRPVGIQIFGEDADIMAKAAQICEEKGADFVDINLGCPVPKVVKKGAGAAMLREPAALQKLLSTIKSAIKIPLTIKIRTGWDDATINTSDIVQAAYDAGVTWVAIHGRTRAQGYSGLADWDLITRVKEKSPVPIIGNGDVNSASKAVMRLKQTGVDGVMIGRGCLKNPWIFKQSLDLLKNGDHFVDNSRKDFGGALLRLKELVDERTDERRSTLTMKKFAAWFSAGYPNSQQFRRDLFAAESSTQILDTARNYFDQFDISAQMDTSHEPFLMGGHG
jgi:tRNA-dihydrouridine synthase B